MKSVAGSSTTRVVIVDDSPVARMALRRALESDPAITVTGEAAGGAGARALVARQRPDLVTMDVQLGEECGIDVTAELMRASPVPVLIVTARDPRDPKLIYDALEAGALDVFGKLPPPSGPEHQRRRRRLQRLVKALARVPVVRRRRFHPHPGAAAPRRAPPRASRTSAPPCSPRLILIGSSTGGPPVLSELLRALPAPFSRPIVIAQHVAVGFDGGMVDWLHRATGHRTTLVRGDVPIRAGTVFVAPADQHLYLPSPSTLALLPSRARHLHTPSIDMLFGSAAVQVGAGALALVLTGMGRDGARGVAALGEAGAGVWVQEPSSCAVVGMPESALATGAVQAALMPAEIGRRLSLLS